MDCKYTSVVVPLLTSTASVVPPVNNGSILVIVPWTLLCGLAIYGIIGPSVLGIISVFWGTVPNVVKV